MLSTLTLNLTITLFLFSIASFVHFLHCNWKLKKNLHILQLNSYRNTRYIRWLVKKTYLAFNPKDLLPFVAIFPLFFSTTLTSLTASLTVFLPPIALITLVIIYAALFIWRSRDQERKPLVFTMRVIRLYSFNLLILLIGYITLLGGIWQSSAAKSSLLIAILILAITSFASPVLLIITNFLILPLEKIINQYYFNDAKKRLQAMSNLLVIGITGSFGKTSAKYILNEILRHKYRTLMTPGSFNTPMGIAKVVRNDLKPTHEIFIAEVSAKQKGDIKELCDLLHPRFGLITAIGEQHLETFKNIENIKNTKNELIEALPEDNGVAFFNVDNKYCQELAQLTKKKSIYYGIDEINNAANDLINSSKKLNLDYIVKNIRMDSTGSVFTVCKKNDEGEREIFATKLLGRHNIYNILAAIAIASELGMKLEEMVYPIRQLNPVPHRLELKKITKDITLIDDSFNANPIGSKMALEVLQNMVGKRKIIVTPGMVELGAEEYNYNRQFGEYVAAVCDYVILVGRQQTKPLQDGLFNKNFPLEKIVITQDFPEANQHLQSILQPEDVVLFENDLPDNYKE